MNKVIIMGRLTRDPDVRYTQANDAIARFTVAVDRRVAKGEGQKADFIPCTAWTKKAEFAEKYLKQGTKVVVTGRIQTGSYTDRDGRKVYTTDVIAEDIEFAESKATQAVPQPQIPATDEFIPVPENIDSELPFN